MRIGGSNVDERTPESEGDETRNSDAEADDSSAGSAEQAKKREREMEESGEENAG
jgi:hypothetical protein